MVELSFEDFPHTKKKTEVWNPSSYEFVCRKLEITPCLSEIYLNISSVKTQLIYTLPYQDCIDTRVFNRVDSLFVCMGANVSWVKRTSTHRFLVPVVSLICARGCLTYVW